MAKNPSRTKRTGMAQDQSETNSTGNGGGEVPAESKAAKPKAKPRKPANTSAEGKRPARKTTGRKKAGETASNRPRVIEEDFIEIDEDAVRLRAYFISEWRSKNGMSGDSAHDWLEARRQLQAEAQRNQ